MSTNSDARVDTEDHDPYNAEPARSDPWASGPGHLPQDGQETERFVPEQRDGDHDGHLYASDTYAEPETEVLPEGKGATAEAPTGTPAGAGEHHQTDDPTAVGVAHVDGSDEPTAVVDHSDHTADHTADHTGSDAEAKADVAADEAEEARVAAMEAREDAEAARDEATIEHGSDSRPGPAVETVPLAAAEPVAVVPPGLVAPVGVEPVDGRHDSYDDSPSDDHHDSDHDSDSDHDGDRHHDGHHDPVEPFGEPVAAEPEVGTDDLVAVPAAVGSTDEHAGELKPGDVPVAPVTGFFAADSVSGLRDRWREAQLGFVDDPRKAVDDVKALVSEAVDQFTAAVSAQRDELDAAAGEDTEQYRVAVQRYRAFFDRLLGL